MQNRWVPFFVTRFIYLSLPFFDKSEEECETGFEKWIYILKYMEMAEVSLDTSDWIPALSGMPHHLHLPIHPKTGRMSSM